MTTSIVSIYLVIALELHAYPLDASTYFNSDYIFNPYILLFYPNSIHLVYANAVGTFSSFISTVVTGQPPNTPDNKLVFFGADLHGNL